MHIHMKQAVLNQIDQRVPQSIEYFIEIISNLIHQNSTKDE